jgi:N-acetylglutamate synthase-like GNAT family acetyltransferase
MENLLTGNLLNGHHMKYIRKATHEDIERIKFIVEQCWGLVSDDSESRKKINLMVHDFYSYGKLTNDINNDVSTFLLAIDGELAVAFASFRFEGKDIISTELNALYCLPQTQGKRFDELLVNEVIKNTSAAGGHKIFVVLTHYNGPVGLFERLGFEPVKITDDKKSNFGILVMSKNIKMP